MKNKRLTPVYRAMLLLFILFLASCGGQTGKNDGSGPVSDPKLNAAYSKVLVLPVDIGEQFAKEYPQAATDCRDGVLEELSATKRFQVNPVDAAPATPTELHTLVVKLAITDVRIVSKVARSLACGVVLFVGGAIAGSSHVNIKMTLTDGYTGQVIREKEFSTHNNPMAACWGSGTDHSIDKTIPKDMGKIIGDYITTVVPQAGSPTK